MSKKRRLKNDVNGQTTEVSAENQEIDLFWLDERPTKKMTIEDRCSKKINMGWKLFSNKAKKLCQIGVIHCANLANPFAELIEKFR